MTTPRSGTLLAIGLAAIAVSDAGARQEPTPVLKLAFSSERDSGPPGSYLWMMNPDGSKPEVLEYRRIVRGYPACSPHHQDERRSLLETSDRDTKDGTKEIYLKDPDGGPAKRLTRNNSDDEIQGLAPDGDRVLFLARTPAGQKALRIVSIKGGTETILAADGYYGPAFWSSDGKAVAYVWGKEVDFQIRTIRADGTGERTLTKDTPDRRRGSNWKRLLAWSPDGKWLLYRSDIDGIAALWILKSDGSGVRRLAEKAYFGHSVECAWSPDSKTIAFVAVGVAGKNDLGSEGANSNLEIFTVDVDGSGVKNVSNNWKDDTRPQYVLVK